MKKRLLSALLVSVMSLSLLAGCGGQETEEAGEGGEGEGGGKITFMAPDWAIPTEDQLAAFTEETGIEVECSEVGWDDIREKIATAASANKCAADVVEVDWSWVGEFYAADWLEPLEVSEEDKADMPTIETFTVDDQVLAMPYANDYRLSYYNTEQFAAAGIIEEPQTWDDVLEACRALKETGTVEHPFAIALNAEEKTSTCLMWLAYTMNGVVWNEDGTFNEDYCKWCYADGVHLYSDMEDLIEVCVKNMPKDTYTEEEVRAYLRQLLPQLEYWKRAGEK